MPLYTMPDGSLHEFESDEVATRAYKAWDTQYGEKPVAPVVQPAPQPVAQEPSLAAQIAANPITRFATSAASPIMGAGEWLPGALGKFFADNNAELKKLVDEGKIDQGDLMKIAGGGADIAGTIMSPAFLKLAKVLPAAKTFKGLAAQGAGVGAIGGAVAPTGSSELSEKAIATGTGALFGGVATPALSTLARMGTNAIAPIVNEGAAERGAARLVSKVAGPQRQSIVAQAFSGASPQQSAAQASLPTGIYEIPALQQLASNAYIPSQYGAIEKIAENARRSALQGVTPSLEGATSTRSANMSKRMGEATEDFASKRAAFEASVRPEQVVSTPTRGFLGEITGTSEKIIRAPEFAIAEVNALKNNPVMEAAIADARRIAANRKDLPEQFSGWPQETVRDVIQDPTKSLQGLQMIKFAIDQRFKNKSDTSSSLSKFDDASLSSVKSAYMNALEKASDKFKAANQGFAKDSEVVDQSKILNRMQAELRKPTDTGERVTPFLNVLGKGEDALIKKSTGMPRYVSGDLQNILSPTQMKVVSDIVGQLKSGAEISKQEREGMTATVKALKAELDPNTVPNLLNAKVSLFNSIIRMLEGTGGKKVERKVAEMMLPGNVPRLGKLMQEYQASPYGMMSAPVRMGGIPSAVSATGLFGERE